MIHYTQAAGISWQRLMLNLRSAGLSAAAVGRRCSMDPQTAGRLARGDIREPRFAAGLALLDLHHALCPEQHRLEDLRT
jgi:hypothetical protein